jgi:hypothetical protein
MIKCFKILVWVRIRCDLHCVNSVKSTRIQTGIPWRNKKMHDTRPMMWRHAVLASDIILMMSHNVTPTKTLKDLLRMCFDKNRKILVVHKTTTLLSHLKIWLSHHLDNQENRMLMCKIQTVSSDDSFLQREGVWNLQRKWVVRNLVSN